MLVLAGTHGNVLRLLVPLVVSLEDLRTGLDIIEAGLMELAPEPAP
jgi:4-aminobutyrate aminotransferase-like enzyme